MSTRLDMQSRIQIQFSNSTYYSVQDMNDSIQDGVDEICAFTGCVYKATSIPFSVNTTYYDMVTLLPDYIGVVAIFNNLIRRWMIPTSLRKLEQIRPDWDSIYGTPTHFSVISHRYLAVWAKPSVSNYGQMYVYYRAAAPTLTDTTQLPILDEFLSVLDDYSQFDLYEQAQEWKKASITLQEYQEDLEELRVLVRNQRNSDRLPGLHG